MNSDVKLVTGTSADLEEMQELFVNTINVVCSFDYNPSQILAWTSGVKKKERWNTIVNSQYLIVAKFGNKIIGFGSLERGDYLNMLFVHKDFQKQGVASLIYRALESEALSNNKLSLHADVSITAKPFFLRQGFEIITEQEVKREGIILTNYRMMKHLKTNSSALK